LPTRWGRAWATSPCWRPGADRRDVRQRAIGDAFPGGAFLPDQGRATGVSWMLGIGRFGRFSGPGWARRCWAWAGTSSRCSRRW
jgi:hypothetical protein